MSKNNARMAVAEVISENMTYWGYTSKEVAILSGIHESTIAKLLNGQIDVNIDHSERLSTVFKDWTGTTLIDFYNKKIENLEVDDKNDELVKYLESVEKFKLMDELSIRETLRHTWPGRSRIAFNEFLINSNANFSQYKDKALAQLWVALMFNKHSLATPSGDFKKSSYSTIFKNVFDRFFKDGDFNNRFKEIKDYLDKSGIVVENGPFIANSSIRGVSFNKNHNRYIFLSDMGKREFWWLLSLIHELLHFYSQNTDETEIDKEAESLIKNYIAKNNVKHKDFDAFFKKQLETDWDNKSQEAKDEYFAWLRENTTRKINFGDASDLL